MDSKKKAMIVGIVGLILLAAFIIYLSYLGLSKNPAQVEELKVEANQYLEKNYEKPYEITDTLYDNIDIYKSFNYAAIVRLEGDAFSFLVYEHHDSNQLMDSYVAETWEYELENYLRPLLNESFGEKKIKELWLSYPKDAGFQYDISHEDIPSLKDFDAAPTIRITLNRGKTEEDDNTLDHIIEKLKSDLNIDSGYVTLDYADSALLFKDKSIRKDF